MLTMIVIIAKSNKLKNIAIYAIVEICQTLTELTSGVKIFLSSDVGLIHHVASQQAVFFF